MRVALPLLAAALALAGCQKPPAKDVFPELELTILDVDFAGLDIEARLVNTLDRAIQINARGFHLLDGNGTEVPADPGSVDHWKEQSFPRSLVVAAGGGGQGWMRFANDHTGPFVLTYDYTSHQARANVTDPAPDTG